MRIGVISDTHGLLRPEALDALRGSDHIIHAGDIGSPDILPELRKIAPVTAVKGNIDPALGAWTKPIPTAAVVELEAFSFYVLHDLRALDLNPKTAGLAAVITGHTHRPEYDFRNGVLYFNPGSAGPRRFKLPIAIGRIRLDDGELLPEIVLLGN